jgi:hypothetical protein
MISWLTWKKKGVLQVAVIGQYYHPKTLVRSQMILARSLLVFKIYQVVDFC